MCDEVRRVVLIEGDTMIIPAGYIHAVVCHLAYFKIALTSSTRQ